MATPTNAEITTNVSLNLVDQEDHREKKSNEFYIHAWVCDQETGEQLPCPAASSGPDAVKVGIREGDADSGGHTWTKLKSNYGAKKSQLCDKTVKVFNLMLKGTKQMQISNFPNIFLHLGMWAL